MVPQKNRQISGGTGYCMYVNGLYSALRNVASKKRANLGGYGV